MNFAVDESFFAVGYDGSTATFVPVLSLSFIAVRERITFNETFNITNFFARRDNFYTGDDGAFLYKTLAGNVTFQPVGLICSCSSEQEVKYLCQNSLTLFGVERTFAVEFKRGVGNLV